MTAAIGVDTAHLALLLVDHPDHTTREREFFKIMRYRPARETGGDAIGHIVPVDPLDPILQDLDRLRLILRTQGCSLFTALRWIPWTGADRQLAVCGQPVIGKIIRAAGPDSRPVRETGSGDRLLASTRLHGLERRPGFTEIRSLCSRPLNEDNTGQAGQESEPQGPAHQRPAHCVGPGPPPSGARATTLPSARVTLIIWPPLRPSRSGAA